jgi:hypothetical protein
MALNLFGWLWAVAQADIELLRQSSKNIRLGGCCGDGSAVVPRAPHPCASGLVLALLNKQKRRIWRRQAQDMALILEC